MLEADSANEERFSEADLAFMKGFAALLGFAIKRQRTEARLREMVHDR